MSGNRIYRGPMHRQPETVSDKTVAAALLPGTFVTEGATFAQATTPVGLVRLLANRDFYSLGALDATDPQLVPYVSGETAVAYILEPGQRYQAAAAAATYTFGQALTIAAAGRVAAAATGNVVIGFCLQAGAAAAGALIDIELANRYAQP